MDLSAIIILAAIVSILANALKVWEFGSSRLFSKVCQMNATLANRTEVPSA
jgi:FlaG/FlaF family flagellin (archaellin)